ncbi:hypothetical protein BGZ51_008307 [Haplosporangium sp. Z 767]|nr:hypothetical protein BGZ51_008307 [Haplosporangium sp. Z 767]KAF9178007.1 hypothetical protein BGZ50_008167 [Haplosporangium sp. Z 11]
MSVQLSTAWMDLVVRRTTHRLDNDEETNTEVVCQWDGQDVTLLHDHSPGTEVDKAYITSLKIGNRISVRGKMTITPYLNQHKNAAMRVSLLVHKVKTMIEQTNEPNSDETSSDEPGSDEPGSNRVSNDESGSNKFSSSEPNSDGLSSADSNGSGHEDHEEEVDLRPSKKRARTLATGNSPQRRSRDTGGPHDHDSYSDCQEDTDSDSGHVEHGNLSLVKYAEEHEVIGPRIPGAGLAGSTPRAYEDSFNAEQLGLQACDFVFNGRGQSMMCGVPLQQINGNEFVYSFNQGFSDGSRREICVATRMAAHESVDTLIVYENIFGPIDSGVTALGRVLK